ncbi:MAG: hypothetical protein ACFFB5_01830 [Promethearchaeota archaeon]
MSDRLERETIKKLTSVSSVLKNPYKNLEDILTQLGEIDKDFQNISEGEYQKELEFPTIGEKARKALIEVEEESNNPGESLTKVLRDLGEMFRVCGICGKGTMENELVSGVCFDCYRKGEVIHAQNRKIGELEAQVRNMESKLGNSSSRDYMSDIIDEILATIRKDIEHDLKSIKSNLSSAQRSLPPPPPPPKTNTQDNGKIITSDLDFSNMTLAELKKYIPEFLSELPISQRNQYNSRLKELQLIEKMTQKQKKEYFQKKRKEQEQAANLDELRDSLKNLSESDSPLFLKMKQQAEKSVLVGQGTLGNFGLKEVFVNCPKCNTTNKIIESKKARCKKCRATLRT